MTATARSPIDHEEPSPMTTTQASLPLTARHPSDGWRRTLPAVLRSERIKATTVRANKVLLASAATIGLLVTFATARFTDDPLTATEVLLYPTLLNAVLAAIAGIVLFTSEIQHGTLAGALAAHPTRWPVAAAKILTASGLGLLVAAVGTASGFVGAVAGGLEVGTSSGLAARLGWAVLYTVGSALLGLGVGMVVRHGAGAVSGLLVWWLVVEGLIVSFAPPGVVRFVPFDAGARTLGIESDMDRPEVVAAQMANALHASIFWGYVVVALIVGTTVLVRRDAD